MAKKDNIKFKMPYRKQPFYNSIVKFVLKILLENLK